MKLVVLLGAALCMGLSAAHVSAQEAGQTGSFDVSTLTCADLASAPETDASLAIVMVYGYVAGDRDYTNQSAFKIQKVIQTALEICASAPEKSVMSALEDAGIGSAS